MKAIFTIALLTTSLFDVCHAEEADPAGKRQANIQENQSIKRFLEQLEQSENEDKEEIKEFIEAITKSKTNEDYLKNFMALNEKHPDNQNILLILAIISWRLEKMDEAKEYIDKSIKIKKTDKSLEIFTLIYVARRDLKGMYEKLKDLESVENKSAVLIMALFVLSDEYSDVELYRRTSKYIKDNEIDDPGVIRYQSRVAALLLEKGKNIEVEK